ncbi:MAG: DUF4386 family protein [Phycisphaerae bacterium]|nr:DUF4386 domain-containing protein [Phycisphaerae bacterium]NIU55212.1 DUF4386 family protein [Phycisphaerae bacterium]NIW91890.1 DUF4386 family protein [Phycisphaerae bacterium]NIX26518.1 DUF4386 family protein [Phycisphaerae bacterium]
MTISTIDESQRKAARVVGFMYLLFLPFGVFAEFYAFGQLVVYDNAAETARNIMAHERLFRLGIAANLIGFATVVVLITALYVVLKPVNRNFALGAAFFRLIEVSMVVVTTLNDLDVLRALSGADYLRVFEADRLQALARLSIGASGAAYSIGLLFFGIGSSVFCYLWFKSKYIPRALAAWGVLASLWTGACVFASIIFPEFAKVVTVFYYGGPIFFFELTMGFWLLLKGLRPSRVAEVR